jgi:hypothetical protein
MTPAPTLLSSKASPRIIEERRAGAPADGNEDFVCDAGAADLLDAATPGGTYAVLTRY